ncbi:MAG: phospholipase A [Bacteroidota bacterium]|nr:phospholipase A [Bacteroidota bacterium]
MRKCALLYSFFLLCFVNISAQELILEDSLRIPDTEVPKNRFSNALSKMFELEKEDQRGVFRPSVYRPMYVIPFRWTDRVNRQPINTNPVNGNPPYRNYQSVEAKFQVSIKAKVWQDFLGMKGDFWVAFTQQAYWQVYNEELSRPFRELNYEPELMYIMPLKLSIGDFKWQMTGLSFNHQSNGKEQLYSRSWNRVIFMNAFEWRNLILVTRLWKRIQEKEADDDNKNIEDFVGKMELTAFYSTQSHSFIFTMRNNLNKKNKAFAELTYIYPVGSGGLRLFAQLSTGYGDSLIEFNHKQTTIGVGVILSEF